MVSSIQRRIVRPQREPGGLNHFVSNYLTTSGGQLTPAGQALVNAGIMTQQDLVSLGATTPVSCSVGQHGFLSNGIPCINTPPGSNAGLGRLKSIDLRLAWTLHIKDRVRSSPRSRSSTHSTSRTLMGLPTYRVASWRDARLQHQ